MELVHKLSTCALILVVWAGLPTSMVVGANHSDSDWPDACRDAIGCRMTQGDLIGGNKASSYHKMAEDLARYFDLDLLHSTMERFQEFLGGTGNTDDTRVYSEMKSTLTSVGIDFYPANKEELKLLMLGGQALAKLVKRERCQAAGFTCAGEVAKLAQGHKTAGACDLSWQGASVSVFGCKNIEGWPDGIKKVLGFEARAHTHWCPALRAGHCVDEGRSGVPRRANGHAPASGLERRGIQGGICDVYQCDEWVYRSPEDPECQQHGRSYEPLNATVTSTKWFGELKCGRIETEFDGNVNSDHTAWRSRTEGAMRASQSDWLPWESCPPKSYATSITSFRTTKGVQNVHMSCMPPRWAEFQDFLSCNGPLTGIKVVVKHESEGGPNYITKLSAACASAPTGWLDDFTDRADELKCPPSHAICGHRQFKRKSDGNRDDLAAAKEKQKLKDWSWAAGPLWGGITNLFMGEGFSSVVGLYWEKLEAEGDYVFDIQIHCCRIKYPCNAADMYVADSALDGDFSDANVVTTTRTYITGVDKGTSQSGGGSESEKTSEIVETAIGYASDAFKLGVEMKNVFSQTGGHSWAQDSAMGQSTATRVTVQFKYPEGLHTRYFRPLGVCGVGRVLSSETPFAVSFVSTTRCTLSNVYSFVGVTGSGGQQMKMGVGVNFTTPPLTFVTGPPFLEYHEIVEGLETRLLGEFKVNPRSRRREPTDDHAYASWSDTSLAHPTTPPATHPHTTLSPDWLWDPEKRNYFKNPAAAAPTSSQAPASGAAQINPADIPPIFVDGKWKKFVDGQGYVEVEAEPRRRRGPGGAERRSGMMIRMRHGEPTAGTAQSPWPDYLEKLETRDVTVKEAGAVFQHLIRCTAPKLPDQYILIHTDETKVVPIPDGDGETKDEYVIVKTPSGGSSFKDTGTQTYSLRTGVVWPEIESMSFVPAAVDMGLRDKLLPKLSGLSSSSPNKYDWGRNDEWMVHSAGGGDGGGALGTQIVEVKDGREVELRQMVGTVGQVKVYTGHVERIEYSRSDRSCIEGTGIFKDCKL